MFYRVCYAFGTVLAGYMMVAPFWAVGAIWNRLVQGRSINPWILPAIAMAVIYSCFALVTVQERAIDWNHAVVTLGLLPGTIGCVFAARRYHRAKRADEQTLSL